MIRISMIGNLAADAEVKNANGKQYLVFRLADTRKWKDAQGQQHEETQWASCIMNADSVNILPYLRKGTKVYIEGNPSIEIYSSPKLRAMTARYNINVQHVELCGGLSDLVPKRLVGEGGELIDIVKAYYIPANISEPYRGKTLYGERGGTFVVDAQGYVLPDNPYPQPQAEGQDSAGSDGQNNN